MRSKLNAALGCTALASVALLAACANNADHEGSSADDVAVAVTDAGQDLGLITARPVAGWDVFGGDVTDRAPLPVGDLLTAPETFDGEVVVVEGEVAAACAKKGCWMIVKSDDEQMRVRFQDYAFFVPIESAGRTARIEGVFSITETSVEDLRHYLEDEGKFEEAAAVDAPKREYELLATGVRMKQ